MFTRDARNHQVERDGQFSIPHTVTFAGMLRGAYRTYLHERWDEAMRDSRENALAMKHDCWLMAMLRERMRAVARCKWHLEVDNPKDKWQAKVKNGLQRGLERMPRLRRFLRGLLWATWYGRYGVKPKYRWSEIGGEKILHPGVHEPVNGDKIGWTFDGIPYVLIQPSQTDQLGQGAQVIMTTQGQGLLLTGGWREQLVIHQHDIEDADFYDIEGGDQIHGVGVRHWIYWLWFVRDEYLAWIAEQLERSGLGVVLIKYDQSNAEAKQAALDLSKKYSRRTVMTLPVPPGLLQARTAGGAYGMEVVETPTAGMEVLDGLRQRIEDMIERFMIGQSASARSQTSGMGTHDTGFQEQTKSDLIAEDAEDVSETFTGSAPEPGVVSTMQRWSYPWSDFPVRFVLDVETADIKEKLEGIKAIVEMGGRAKADEARELVGISKPGPGDEVLGQQAQQGPPGQNGQQPGNPLVRPDLANSAQGHPLVKPHLANGSDNGNGKKSGGWTERRGPRGGHEWVNAAGTVKRGMHAPNTHEEEGEPEKYDFDADEHPREDDGKFALKHTGPLTNREKAIVRRHREKVRAKLQEPKEGGDRGTGQEKKRGLVGRAKDAAIKAVVEKAKSWLTPAGLARKARAILRGVTHPVETAKEVQEAAQSKFTELSEKYGTSGALVIVGGYVGYYTAAAMNPAMLAYPFPLMLTTVTTARLVRWAEKKMRGVKDEEPVRNARGGLRPLTVERALQEVKVFLSSIARAHGERSPQLDDDLMRAVLHQLLERSRHEASGEPERYAGWDESKHPRGQPENAGEFGPGGSGGGATGKTATGRHPPVAAPVPDDETVPETSADPGSSPEKPSSTGSGLPSATQDSYQSLGGLEAANNWKQENIEADLDVLEQSALEKYRGGAFKEINDSLRSGGTGGLWCKKIDQAIAKSTVKKSVVVVRGIRHPQAESFFTAGKVFTDKAFISTSLRGSTASAFTSGGAGKALVEIHVPAGAHGASVRGAEGEILLPRNSRFHVQEAKRDEAGVLRVRMELIVE